MGENTGGTEHLGEDEIRFTVHTDGFEREYGPYPTIGKAMWEGGFTVGYLAAKGYRPTEITIDWYVNGELSEVTGGPALEGTEKGTVEQ
jgi:hypothetical protein